MPLDKKTDLDISDTSLYRVIVDKAADTTRILVAYRSITLLPSHLSGAGIVPPEGSVRLPLAIAGAYTTKHIRLHVENLYLVAGSTFEFPGKTVIITANRVVLFSSTAVTAGAGDNVIFDCTGASGASVTAVGTAGNNGEKGKEDHRYEMYAMSGITETIFRPSAKPTGGGNGTNGGDCSSSGQPAGTFVLNARSVTLLPYDGQNPNRHLEIVIKSAGGSGGRGGNGGAGGSGGNGAIVPSEETVKHYGSVSTEKGASVDGATGGNGGSGGKGANGGAGGLILSLVGPSAGQLEDANSGASLVKKDVSGGKGGEGGSGGARGSGGNGGSVRNQENGKKGSDGGEGQHGANGQPGADGHVVGQVVGDKGAELLQYEKALAEECRAETLDVVQLTMTMERLMFEYSILLSGYAVTPDNTEDTATLEPLKKAFQETFDWLMCCFDDILSLSNQGSSYALPDAHGSAPYATSAAYQEFLAYQKKGWKNSVDIRSGFLQVFVAFCSRCSTPQERDLYGQDVKFISQPNIHLTTVGEALTALESIEGSYKECLNEIGKAIGQKEARSKSEAQLTDAVNDAQKTIDALQKSTASGYEAVKSARDAVQEARKTVQQSVEKLWNAHKWDISSDLGPVLEAIGTVCLFAHPGVGTAFKLGGALTIGMGLNKLGSSISTPQGAVSKDALHGKVLVVENTLVSTALKEDITQKTASLQQLSGIDKEYVNSVMVNRKNFEELVNTYFVDASQHGVTPEEVKQARKDFDFYMEVVQKFHAAVTSYNDTFTSLAQAAATKAQAEHGKAKLQVTNFSADIPALDLLTTLYSSLHHAAKLETLRILFDASRAASCVFLRRCDLLRQLFPLGSWSNVSAKLLRDATVPALCRQVADYQSSFNTKPPIHIGGRTISISKTGPHKDLVERFRDTRRLSLFLDDASATGAYDFDINWYDIRLEDLQIYFHGAKNTRAQPNVDTRIIDVEVQLGGVFFVHDEKYRQYTFEVPQTDVTFEYKYGDEAGREDLEPKSKGGINSALTKFSFALGQVHDVSLDFKTPVRSPYMHYVFTVGDHVDVKDVDEIEIKMDLRVRTGQRPKGFKVGSVVVTPSAFSVLG
ncbi:hypothetical protein SMACR_04870 [Sordaria macrospora]|uniref:Uncharacterized protein n=1 Tax=Sordaria macrospora TaxID=5147 RepID=A0A8S8ZZJ3_SORMA|nr:hypothetical protein SMACR_04870 [Sordaria macrospora]WPJ59445.1 hypothetical protein SMAC4_04870 [Sordaria macrospora]